MCQVTKCPRKCKSNKIDEPWVGIPPHHLLAKWLGSVSKTSVSSSFQGPWISDANWKIFIIIPIFLGVDQDSKILQLYKFTKLSGKLITEPDTGLGLIWSLIPELFPLLWAISVVPFPSAKLGFEHSAALPVIWWCCPFPGGHRI